MQFNLSNQKSRPSASKVFLDGYLSLILSSLPGIKEFLMNVITDRQANIELFSRGNELLFRHEGKMHAFQCMDKVHTFFQKRPFDTVKFSQKGKKSFIHFHIDGIEHFDSKRALRKALSQEWRGAWVEEKSGKTRYFVDKSSWFNTSFREVSKKEYFEKLEAIPTVSKVIGVGLGLLALLPGALEITRRFPFGPREVGIGLLSIQQKSPFLGAFGLSILPSSVEAQAAGTEFQVNSYTASDQRFPDVAPLNDGGFVVVWMSSGQDGSGDGVYMQRYDNNSIPYGVESQVNTYQTDGQYLPNIAPLNNGGFVITWISSGQDAELTGIYGQLYASDNVAAGSEFRINTYQSNHQDFHSVTTLVSGGFVVTWQSLDQDGADYGIFGQRYGPSGVAVGSEFQVNTYTTSNQRNPSVTDLIDGGFVATWQSFGQDVNLDGIFGQRYDSSGIKVESEFQINTYTTGNQNSPSAAALNNGGFVVTWASNGQDGSNQGVFGQRYDSSTNTVGSEFQVNTYTVGSQYSPSIIGLNDGGFVVAWESSGQDGSSNGIFGQRYDTNGMPVGTEFQVNTHTMQGQHIPSIAALKDGGFVIIWESYLQEGDGYGIIGQRYDVNGIAVGPPTLTSMSPSSPLATTTSSTHASSQASSTNSLKTSRMQLSSNVPSLPTTTSTSMTRPSSQASLTNTLRSSSTTPSLLSSSTSIIESAASDLTSSPSPQANSLSLSSSAQPNIKSTSVEPSEPTPSSFSSSIASSAGSEVSSIGDIVYGESYPVLVNGQIIGTYTINGGTGLIDTDNTNVITIHFNSSYQPEEGDILTLFEIPEGLESNSSFQGATVVTDDFECLEAQEEIETGSPGSSYNIIFELKSSCTVLAPRLLTGVISIVGN